VTYLERRAWLIVGAQATTLFFVIGGGYDAQSVVMPAILRHFGWPRAQLGLVFLAAGVAAMLSVPLAGWLLDRIKAQIVVSIGAITATCGLVCAGEANSFPAMMASFVVFGAGAGFAGYVSTAFIVANWFIRDRGLAMGIAMAGETAGATIMTLVASFAVSWGGWRIGFYSLAIPIVVFALPFVLAVVRTCPPGVEIEHGKPGGVEPTSGMEVSEAIRSRSFFLIAFAELCGGFFTVAVLIPLVTYLGESGYSPRFAALSVCACMALATLGQPLMGIVADRIAPRKALAIAYFLNAISFIALLRASNVLCLVIFVVLYGSMLTAPVTLLAMVLTTCCGLKRYGSLAGIMGFFWIVGASFGPFGSGRIYDIFGSYLGAFVLCSLLAFLGGIATCFTVPLPTAVQSA